MIEIIDKSMCCGCEACKNICPKKCITMKEDKEGFRYPSVDLEKCINCKLCEKVCPIINKTKNSEEIHKLEMYAAYNKDDNILRKSSSGGIFWLLAKWIFNNNGIVYGVIQDGTYDVKYARAENEEQCQAMRGSKYLQAKVDDTYLKVKEDLENDKFVLFSGTPCQIAGLYKVLNKNYEKLYTVDVVCHGVPSSKVYRRYIENIQCKYNKEVINIKWRDKVNGWGPNRITLYFKDNTKHTTISRENPFQKGFLDNIYLRPSCYKCIYARLPRIGDISLADFWGYDGKLCKENKNKGISAIIVSSKKGKKLFENIKEQLNYHEVSQDYLTSRSRHTYIHPEENKLRTNFFEDFENMSFNKLCRKYNMKESNIKIILKKIKRKIFK